MPFIITTEDSSPIYNSEAEALNSVLRSTKSLEEKLEALQTFSDKYTVVPSFIWLAQNQIYKENKKMHRGTNTRYPYPLTAGELRTINGIAFSHIIQKFLDINKMSPCLNKLIERGPSDDQHFVRYPELLNQRLLKVEFCKKLLSFPNSRLPEYYSYCEMHLASPLSKEIEEKYQQSLILYKKIKESRLKIEEWIECLKETNDVNFIIQNIECRIGESPFDKKIWKIYINVLKDFQLYDLMYHTYSRYCSLFINDLEMRQKFKSEVEASSEESVSKWKLDVVKTETNFGTFESAISLFKTYFPFLKIEINAENFESEFKKVWEEKRSESQSPVLKYIFDEKTSKPSISRKSKKCLFKNDAIHQTFSLPSTAINFMLKNAKYEHLQKLYETSKYFFARLQSPLCYKLKIGVSPNTVSFQQSLFLSSKTHSAESENIHKCHVKEMIHIQNTPPSYISSIITNKIYKLEISTLSLSDQSINYGDFLKLISTVQTFYVKDAYVFDGEGRNMSVPEIIAEMPSIKVAKIKHLDKHPPFPPNSKVPKLRKKLERFECQNCGGPNDFGIMCQFLKKNLTINAIVTIGFYCHPVAAETAEPCISKMFNFWKTHDNFNPNVKIKVNSNTFSFLKWSP